MTTLYAEQKGFIRHVVKRSGVAFRDVEDVTHDVFIQIGEALDRFDPGRGESLRAWVRAIAWRTARDRLELRRTSEDPIGLDVEVEPSLFDEQTAEDAIIEAEQRAYVRHLVGQGDEVLGRAILQGQTWAQIAADLGISITTVQSRVRRAQAVLEARLRRRRAAARFTPPR